MSMGMTQYREREKEIMTEIFSLVEEQTRALESRPCDRVAAQCEERSRRIRDLLRQVTRSSTSFGPQSNQKRDRVV